MTGIKLRISQIQKKRSHLGKLVRTPGGFLVGQRSSKKTCTPSCPVTGMLLNGASALRTAYKGKMRHSSTRRAYGTLLSGHALRERIIRAFLAEEQKIVQRVLLLQKAKA
jgi:large subunit ribosomal protein L34e